MRPQETPKSHQETPKEAPSTSKGPSRNPRAPKNSQETPTELPWSTQGPPRSLQELPGSTQGTPKSFQAAPKDSQEAVKSPQEALLQTQISLCESFGTTTNPRKYVYLALQDLQSIPHGITRGHPKIKGVPKEPLSAPKKPSRNSKGSQEVPKEAPRTFKELSRNPSSP
jgi:hypothetical protein